MYKPFFWSPSLIIRLSIELRSFVEFTLRLMYQRYTPQPRTRKQARGIARYQKLARASSVAGVIDAVVVVVDVFAIVVATVVVVVVEVGAVVAAVVVAAVVVVVEIELALRTQSLPSYRNREHTKSTFESPNDISQWPSPILLFIICCGRQTAKLQSYMPSTPFSSMHE